VSVKLGNLRHLPGGVGRNCILRARGVGFVGTHYSAEDIRERPGMFVGYGDIRGVYHLVFEFVKEVVFRSKDTNVFMKIHLDETDTFCFTCDVSAALKDCFLLEIIKALSCDFDFCAGQDSLHLKFKPDREIFSYDVIEYHKLYGRFKELAQLNANVKFLLTNQENTNTIQFHRGMETMLMDGVYEFGLPMGYSPLSIRFSKDDVEVAASMIYAYASDVALSYVNHDETRDGGTHVRGLLDGILCAFQNYIQSTDIEPVKDHPLFFSRERITGTPYAFDKNPAIRMEDVIEGLNFVISVNTPQPAYAGSVKRELINEDVYSIEKNGVTENIKRMLEADQSFFDSSRVVQKAEIRRVLAE